MQPLFIFSLPRSGSTLLQRILLMDKAIATQPEPWVALPAFYAFRKDEVAATYDHPAMSRAIRGFVESLPMGKTEYRKHVASFLLGLYTAGSPSAVDYFIDKTPRYHLIADELLASFPEGKFIFLWRNPLAVAASMIETWGRGRWNLHLQAIDLYCGLNNLVEQFGLNQKRVVSVRYEDLVSDLPTCLKTLAEYLELPSINALEHKLDDLPVVHAPGRGDPTGQFAMKGLSQKSLDAWTAKLANPHRRLWARKYLEWIGDKRLQVMGYSRSALLKQLAETDISYKYLISDVLRRTYGSRKLIRGVKLEAGGRAKIRVRLN